MLVRLRTISTSCESGGSQRGAGGRDDVDDERGMCSSDSERSAPAASQKDQSEVQEAEMMLTMCSSDSERSARAASQKDQNEVQQAEMMVQMTEECGMRVIHRPVNTADDATLDVSTLLYASVRVHSHICYALLCYLSTTQHSAAYV